MRDPESQKMVTRQFPVKLMKGTKRNTKSQFAALCYKLEEEKLKVLLITSKNTKRWILPKGWPENGRMPMEVAAQEAYEEAGVKGQIHQVCIGMFCSRKRNKKLNDFETRIVSVFPMKVETQHRKYRERTARERRWFSLEKAAKAVDEPQLRKIIQGLDPAALESMQIHPPG